LNVKVEKIKPVSVVQKGEGIGKRNRRLVFHLVLHRDRARGAIEAGFHYHKVT